MIRVNEFDKLAVSPLDEWLQYLKDEYIRPDTTVPGLREARERLEYLRMSPDERRVYDHYLVTLVPRQLERVLGMDARQRGLPVVEIVGTLAEVEIQDVDADHLPDPLVVLAHLHVLGDGLRHAIEHALQIVQLAALLNLDDDDLAAGILGLDVHAVELVVPVLLVRLALEQFHDRHLLTDEHGNQTFEDGEVGLVAEHILRCPVETDISVMIHIAR